MAKSEASVGWNCPLARDITGTLGNNKHAEPHVRGRADSPETNRKRTSTVIQAPLPVRTDIRINTRGPIRFEIPAELYWFYIDACACFIFLFFYPTVFALARTSRVGLISVTDHGYCGMRRTVIRRVGSRSVVCTCVRISPTVFSDIDRGNTRITTKKKKTKKTIC